MPPTQPDTARMRHAHRIAAILAVIFTGTLIRELISLVAVDVARGGREAFTLALAASSAGFWLLWWLLRPGKPAHRQGHLTARR